MFGASFATTSASPQTGAFMARFPKGLLLGAVLLELLILTTQGHSTTEVSPAPLPACFAPVDPDAPEPPTSTITKQVFGLMRRQARNNISAQNTLHNVGR
jgi:hypothetical protein